MREIEFRGKAMKWEYGYLEPDIEIPFIRKRIVGTFVNPETVGEFTGLHDCKGIRAYEGDVIRILTEGETTVERDPTLYLIEWESPRFGAFSPGHIKTVWNWGTFEIVGNIHDDPNLKTLFKENLK